MKDSDGLACVNARTGRNDSSLVLTVGPNPGSYLTRLRIWAVMSIEGSMKASPVDTSIG